MTPLTQAYLDLVSGKRRGVRATVMRAALGLGELPYAAAMAIRNAMYDRGWFHTSRAAVPVVSVGNLTTGGTGKTPCVEYLARFYRERGLQVAILSRGYGRDQGPNDEALVLEENLPDVPHLQGPDRVALAATAVEELESELLILDDGFQHRRLARDLDVVLIDATNPWGHGHLLPRGLMREPKSSLKRAGAVLVSRCDQVLGDRLANLRRDISRYVKTDTPIVETEHQPNAWMREGDGQIALDDLRGRPALAFCGLGHPEAFRSTLAGLGIVPSDFRTFADHHNYTRTDIDGLRNWADSLPADGVVLTTQKDAVKIRLGDLAGRPLYALRIGLAPRPGQDVERLHEHLKNLNRRDR
ncbi:MAG: tetraacyldisaccharide 4'-kinase [Gemmataceae bacterium]